MGYPVPVLYQLIRKVGSGFLALLTMQGRQLFLSVWGVCFIFGYARESRAAYRRHSSRFQSK